MELCLRTDKLGDAASNYGIACGYWGAYHIKAQWRLRVRRKQHQSSEALDEHLRGLDLTIPRRKFFNSAI